MCVAQTASKLMRLGSSLRAWVGAEAGMADAASMCVASLFLKELNEKEVKAFRAMEKASEFWADGKLDGSTLTKFDTDNMALIQVKLMGFAAKDIGEYNEKKVRWWMTC